jgi:hypothetical protein
MIEAVRKSRWFTRGWTLQELIAPKNLTFFTREWERISTKEKLAATLSEITLIPRKVLESGNHDTMSVAQKMSWASRRKTTRSEDIAYCLLGLFDVNMPLLYGEGEKAFIRLQEEIIRRSDDHSIFFWLDEDGDEFSYRGLLAKSPANFARHGHVQCEERQNMPWTMTNLGLQLTVPILQVPRSFLSNTDISYMRTWVNPSITIPEEDELLIPWILCSDGTDGPLAIILTQLEKSKNQYARIMTHLIPEFTGTTDAPPVLPKTIYVRQSIQIPRDHHCPYGIYAFQIVLDNDLTFCRWRCFDYNESKYLPFDDILRPRPILNELVAVIHFAAQVNSRDGSLVEDKFFSFYLAVKYDSKHQIHYQFFQSSETILLQDASFTKGKHIVDQFEELPSGITVKLSMYKSLFKGRLVVRTNLGISISSRLVHDT